MARDPLAVIPSSMSLVIGVLDRAFGFWSLPEAVAQALARPHVQGLGAAAAEVPRGLDERRRSTSSRVFIVRYDRMMADFEGVMDEMCRFLGHEMTPALRATIDKRGEKQRKYESEHRYDLEKFGLTEEQIRRDCAFFYDTFLPPLQLPTAAQR